MSVQPLLSICVPSRNRQFYFQETIKALTASLRPDIEFVFVDNSDDPTIMDEFIQPYLADPRVKFIPSGERVRPMMDNWEVAAEATTGQWINFIGDDDYIDPDVAELIRRIIAVDPDVEAIDWARLNYYWADQNRIPRGRPVPMGTAIHRVPKSVLYERTFRWASAKSVLSSGFSLYHGAISRPFVERTRKAFGGRYFTHPVVDYDSLMKNITLGTNFVYISRPQSVLGACPKSSTATIGSHIKGDKAQADFHAEHVVPMDDWPCYADWPFHSSLGVTACIGMVHHWFGKTFGYRFDGFEENFARACARQCEDSDNLSEFDYYSGLYHKAFASWKGGKYLKHFNPVYSGWEKADPFTGFSENNVYVHEGSPFTQTASDFYRFCEGILVPSSEIEIDLEKTIVDTRTATDRRHRQSA